MIGSASRSAVASVHGLLRVGVRARRNSDVPPTVEPAERRMSSSVFACRLSFARVSIHWCRTARTSMTARARHRPGAERSLISAAISARDRGRAAARRGQRLTSAHHMIGSPRRVDHAAEQHREGLVDDQAAAELAEPARRLGNHVAPCDASIGIVRIDDDGVCDARRQSVEACRHNLAPGARERCGVLAVRRPGNCDRAAGHDVRQDLDQGLRARGGCNLGPGGNLVGDPCGIDQAAQGGAIRQALPAVRRKFLRDRIRPGVDSGRQVEPGFRRAAKLRECLASVATMLHGRVMPLSAGCARGAWPSARWFWLLATNAYATDQPRIASINMCTDQLLLTLADPEQIVGLSPYSRDAARSWAAAEAARFPKLSGEAEDVLVLKPDFVVAGRFTKRATRELLKAQGFRVEEFDAVRTLDETRRQISRMGELVGHPDRASAAIARIDGAVARARRRRRASRCACSRHGAAGCLAGTV